MPVSGTAANESHIILKTKSWDEFFIKKDLSLLKNRPEKAFLSACTRDLSDDFLYGGSLLASMENAPFHRRTVFVQPVDSPWQIFVTTRAVLYFFVKNLY